MILTSPNFDPNGEIPSVYTCDGNDTSPELHWSDAPEGTKSFALSCIDPDSPSGNFIHWMVHRISRDVTSVREGQVPELGEELENGFGNKGYGGPCPGSGQHRYVFTLYALNTDDLGEVTSENFLEVVGAATIEKAELIGLYRRK